MVGAKFGEAHLLHLMHHFVRGVHNLQAIPGARCCHKTLVILITYIEFVLHHIPSPIHPLRGATPGVDVPVAALQRLPDVGAIGAVRIDLEIVH